MLNDFKLSEKLKQSDRLNNENLDNLSISKIKNTYETLSIEKSKKLRQYQSYKEMIETIKKNLFSTMMFQEKESVIYVKPTVNDLSRAIINSCDLAIDRMSDYQSTLYIENPDMNMMTSSIYFFRMILTDLSSNAYVDNNEQKEYKIQIIISDIEKITNQVVSKLRLNSSIRELTLLPSNYIVTVNDIVVNLMTKELFDISEIRLKYDITNKNQFNFVNKSSLSKSLIDQYQLYEQIISRVMSDWSDNDKDVEYLLWQLIYAVLQNDNHDRFVIIKGSGGNGKSTFMRLLSTIAGLSYTVYANIHQFNDPNSINKIDLSTKLILGDDASTSHKLSDQLLSNLKSIITGDPISVPAKYKDNVIVKTNALFVQGTNTDLNVYENNQALKSRMLLIDWTNTDFRSNRSDLTFNLDSLLENQLFVDVWVMMCLEKVTHFKEFTIPESVKNSTDQMIEFNDSYKQFIEDEYYKLCYLKEIPAKLLFYLYEIWRKKNNPGGGSIKFSTFYKQMSEKGKEYHFKLAENRKRFKKSFEATAICLMYNLDINDKAIDLDYQLYFENFDYIDRSEIDSFVKRNHNESFNVELSNREIQTLYLAVACEQSNNRYLLDIYDI